ncbi:MAG: hypothetical protein K6B52_02665 [Clostridiales bacterium]|nr:hypothetical protein [Clostridiales bacterium]
MKRVKSKFNKALTGAIGGKSGLSLVELVIVVAIALTLVAVTGNALIHMYRARANSASEKISAAISQSKINTLSGKKNKLVIYRDDRGDYYSQFYPVDHYEDLLDPSGNTVVDDRGDAVKDYSKPVFDEDNPYEQQKICEKNIDVFFRNLSNDPFQLAKSEKADSELLVYDKIEIEFSSQDGSVVAANRVTSIDNGLTFQANSIITQGVSEEFNNQIRITVEEGTVVNITVYCLTGGIEPNGR